MEISGRWTWSFGLLYCWVTIIMDRIYNAWLARGDGCVNMSMPILEYGLFIVNLVLRHDMFYSYII
jgi:hypothetical protein